MRRLSKRSVGLLVVVALSFYLLSYVIIRSRSYSDVGTPGLKITGRGMIALGISPEEMERFTTNAKDFDPAEWRRELQAVDRKAAFLRAFYYPLRWIDHRLFDISI